MEGKEKDYGLGAQRMPKEGQNASSRVQHQNVFPVQHICASPQYGTFVTSGSDGTYNSWDRDGQASLYASSRQPNSISAAALHREGAFYAYAVGYDWYNGAAGFNPSFRNFVKIVDLSSKLIPKVRK